MAEKDNNIVGRWLEVIQSMSGDNELAVADIAAILGTSVRNAYYTLKLFDAAGLIVNRRHGLFTIDQQSPFFQKLMPTVTFSREQAAYLYRVLYNSEERDNPEAGLLMRKLWRYYKLGDVEDIHNQPRAYKNMSILQRAIKRKRQVVLHDYSSSNSNTVSDRLVEPFLLLGDDTDVRAYELASGKNKTFKISRVGGEVEMLDEAWQNEDKHKAIFTDMFMYSGEERFHIKLGFNLTAYNFMQEEYPHSRSMMTQTDKTHWTFEADVVSYAPIARFIIGLYDDIEVMEDDGLRQYLAAKIKKMSDGL